eukprot:m.20772 g.20772  ORF g.20772 m.20772 type:complete len:104 (-) comp5284_c0_seq1:1043-1354(-)
MIIRQGALFNLLNDLGNDSSSNGFVTLTNSEALSLLEWNVFDELDCALGILSRHNELSIFKKDGASHITSASEKLWTISIDKWSVTTTFLCAQYIQLCVELCV